MNTPLNSPVKLVMQTGLALLIVLGLGAGLATSVKYAIAYSAARMPKVVVAQDGFATSRTHHGLYQASWRPVDGRIPVNEYFSIELLTKTAKGAPLSGGDIRFDCQMPQHGHGMYVEPTVRSEGDGRYVVEGVLLHMRGDWVLSVHISTAEGSDYANFDIRLQ